MLSEEVREDKLETNHESSSPLVTTTSSSSDTSLENNASSKETSPKTGKSTKKPKGFHKSGKHYKTKCDKKSSSELINDHTFPMYITSISHGEDGAAAAHVTVDKLREATRDIIMGKHRYKIATCGIIAIFTDQNDADRVLKLDMVKVFGGPVQIATLNAHDHRYRRYVTIKDVPWCISKSELENALKLQGIDFGEVTRNKSQVRVEVLNSCHVERLRQEGLNFYNCASFYPVVLDNSNEEHSTNDIIQCYKCQGFWHTASHCRNEVRCVRCGDVHNVDCCPRPKTNPICCNCGGNHHAAFKLCPIKLQLQNSVRVAFSLANKPNSSHFRS